MSDEFVYRNENTGDIARYSHRSARLEMLPNWQALEEPETEDVQKPEDVVTPTNPAETPGPGPEEPLTPVVSEPTIPPDLGELEPAEAKAGGDGRGPDAVPERPARAASKADWQAYARARAQDSDEEAAIDGLTKDQLIEQYGGDS